MATAPAAAAATPARSNQRERILDEALRLMSTHGAGNTSMRQLAKACNLNVAAIYHYFPSKGDLLRSVIEERRYDLRLRELPRVDRDLPPQEQLALLMVEMWDGARDEEQIWRLVLGESLRSEPTALTVGSELLQAIEEALARWLAELFPELRERAGAAAHVVMGQLYTAFMEQLYRPELTADEVRRRARAVAALLLPGG